MDKSPYSNPQINQRLSLIRHLVDTSDLILLIEGPTGSGKTVLATWLAESDSPHWACCFIRASKDMGMDELVEQTNRQINRFFEDPDTLTGIMLREKLLDLVKAGRTPVIIIDDAHDLSAEAMATLLELNEPVIHQGVHASIMRLALFSEDTIKLNRPYQALIEAHPDAVHLMHPPRLQLDDVSEYLEYKLKSVGFKGKLPFSEKDLQAFFWQSEGMPGKLNHIAQEFLQSTSRTINLPKELLSKRNLAIVAAAFIMGILAFNHDWSETPETKLAQTETSNEPAPTGTEVEIALPAPVKKESAPELEPTPIPSSAVAPFEDTLKPAAVAKPEPTLASDDSGGIETPNEPESVAPTATPVVAPKPEPAPKPVAPPPKPTGPILHDVKWILNQEASRYTLQLIAVSNKGALLNLIPTSKERTHFASFATQSKGKALHTLIHGSYSSKKAAQEAAENLPASLKKLKPWPRPFSSIQDLLSTNE